MIEEPPGHGQTPLEVLGEPRRELVLRGGGFTIGQHVLEHARQRVDAVREQARQAPALVAMRGRRQILRQQREIGIGIEQKQHAETMPLVGGECLDGRGHGDGSHDGVALDDPAVRVAHRDGQSVRTPRLRRRDLHPLVVRPCARVRPHEIGEPRSRANAEVLCGEIRRHDHVRVRIDDDERDLHGVQQILLLVERAFGVVALVFGAPPVVLEAGEEQREQSGQERHRRDRKRRRRLRKPHQQPRRAR